MSTDTVLTDVKSPQGILLSIVTALNGGKIPKAVDAFNDEFTFNDHALGLAFTDKSRLTEFLSEITRAVSGHGASFCDFELSRAAIRS
jgi:hypothetical protein